MPKQAAVRSDLEPSAVSDLCPVCETRVRISRRLIGLECSSCNGLTHLLCAAKEDQGAFHDLISHEFTCVTCSARATAKRLRHFMDALSPRMQEAVEIFSPPDAARSGPTHSSVLETVLEIPNATLGKFFHRFYSYSYTIDIS